MRWEYIGKYKKDDPERTNRFVPLYGLFYEKDGVIWGYIEQSFSMAFDRGRVRAWRLRDAQLYLRIYLRKFQEEQRQGKRRGFDSGRKYFIYRLTRKSPSAIIKFDFSRWKNPNIKNSEWRNIPFVTNAGGSSTPS